MAAKPPALGDAVETEFLLQHEEHPLPQLRKEIMARIENVLAGGGVQKLILEIGRPIHVYRLVRKEDAASPPEEIPADDLWAQVRNSRMKELGVDAGTDAFRCLFYSFDAMRTLKLKPHRLFVQSTGLLRRWLKLAPDFRLPEVFGVEVEEQLDVPEDCAILVGVSYDETNTQETTGLRIPLDLPPDKVVHLKEKR